jgi:hypothetical protein
VGALDPAHRTLARIAPRGHASIFLGQGRGCRQADGQFLNNFCFSLALGQLLWHELGGDADLELTQIVFAQV